MVGFKKEGKQRESGRDGQTDGRKVFFFFLAAALILWSSWILCCKCVLSVWAVRLYVCVSLLSRSPLPFIPILDFQDFLLFSPPFCLGFLWKQGEREREREDSHLYAVLMDRWRDETNWTEQGLDEEMKQSVVRACACVCVCVRVSERVCGPLAS